MFKNLIAAFILLFSAFTANQSFAASIDTGTPTNPFGSLVDSNDWVAGQFTLGSNSIITSISTYIANFGNSDGTFNLSIYAGGASKPTSDAIFSTSVTYGSSDASWQGVSNLNLSLASGVYWLGIEVNDNQSVFVLPDAAPSPLAHTAFTDGSNLNAYKAFDGIGFGAKINYSTISSVPEADTYAMLIAGLGLIGAISRRKQRT